MYLKDKANNNFSIDKYKFLFIIYYIKAILNLYLIYINLKERVFVIKKINKQIVDLYCIHTKFILNQY